MSENYEFNMPDMTEKYAMATEPKSKVKLEEELHMIAEAIKDISSVIDDVQWTILIGNSRLTETFVEAKLV
jgi:hypothetical protein